MREYSQVRLTAGEDCALVPGEPSVEFPAVPNEESLLSQSKIEFHSISTKQRSKIDLVTSKAATATNKVATNRRKKHLLKSKKKLTT